MESVLRFDWRYHLARIVGKSLVEGFPPRLAARCSINGTKSPVMLFAGPKPPGCEHPAMNANGIKKMDIVFMRGEMRTESVGDSKAISRLLLCRERTGLLVASLCRLPGAHLRRGSGLARILDTNFTN